MKPPIASHYDVEDIGARRQAVLESLHSLFTPLFLYHHSPPATDRRNPITAAGVESLAQIAAKAMLEAAQPRSSPAMTDLNRTSIANRIAECVRRNVPIAAQILWSPKKHWITGPDSYIDLAELAALNTLLRVHTTVRSIYHPGLTFTIDLEDIEFEFMEGAEPELVRARSEYIAGLRKAIGVFGLDDVFLANRISDKAKDKHELQSWMGQMELNYRALKDYWYESERKGIDGYETYTSFEALKRLGWDGPIPLEMRNHYLRRLSFHGVPEGNKVEMILRNLAGILLHYQKNLLNAGSQVQPIKFSFIPPAPGSPSKLNAARIDLRFVPRRLCSLVGSAAPWSTKGLFRERDGKVILTFRSLNSPIDSRTRLAVGHLRMSRQGESLDVRADLLTEMEIGETAES